MEPRDRELKSLKLLTKIYILSFYIIVLKYLSLWQTSSKILKAHAAGDLMFVYVSWAEQ